MKFRFVAVFLMLGLVALLIQMGTQREGDNTVTPAMAAASSVSADKHRSAMQFPTITPDQPPVTPTATTNIDTPALSPIERIRAIQEKTALHQSVLEDHARFSRYPAHNRRFESAQADPVLRHYGTDERVTYSEDKQFALSVASDQKYYLPSQTVYLSAKLLDASGQAQPGAYAAQLIYNETVSLGYLEFSDAQGDGTYQTHLSLSDFGNQILPPGLYKVLITEQRSELVDAVAFVVSEPVIKLTGEYREALTASGDLIFEVEVDVQEANRFYLQASLYTSSDQAIGSSQFANELAPGRHWLPLSFHGRLIHDQAEHGPYWLKNVSIAKVGVPMERIPLQQNRFYSRSYRLEELNDQPHREANKEG